MGNKGKMDWIKKISNQYERNLLIWLALQNEWGTNCKTDIWESLGWEEWDKQENSHLILRQRDKRIKQQMAVYEVIYGGSRSKKIFYS